VSVRFDHSTLGQRVLFGDGAAVENATQALRSLGSLRVALIADGFAGAVADGIAAENPVVARISDIVQHVPMERAVEAVEVVQSSGADALVTIGGGSSTGLGKILALWTGLPIIAIPTTFAGSEATDVWGVTENGRKTTGSDPRVLPRAIVYDVSLLSGLPVESAVASGLNALAHAVDGFWAPRADPIAYLAAVAFASAGSGMHHKICHVLGGAYNLPHAEMHAVVLPYVTQFNASAAPDAARRVSDALGGTPAASGLWRLRDELGAPPSLAAIGLREEDIGPAADLVVAAIPPSNPRPVDRADIERLLRAAWAGTPIEEEK
jgi:maleylacetate reductase